MNKIYFVIVAVALLSDFILKRNLPGDLAVLTQYMLITIILVVIVVANQRKKNIKLISREKYLLSFFIYFIIANYVFQSLISFEVPFIYSITHVLYIGIPILFIPIILRYGGEYNLLKQCKIFLLLMIPINIVGIIQYTVDPSFLLSISYTETGGVILRNSFTGVFSRYPSIFVSADRYSGMGLIQFYYAVILLSLSSERTTKMLLWINFNLFMSIITMLIAGARSRIFIVLITMLLMSLSVFFKRKIRMTQKNINNLVLAVLLIMSAGSLTALYNQNYLMRISEFPVIDLLVTSIKEGQTQKRVGKYITNSYLSEDVTLFGKGLGSLGQKGKPAERGITSLWIECGVISGTLILFGFCGIIFILSKLSYQALIRGHPYEVCLYSLPALSLMLGLVTGLTSVLELSAGILLMSALAGVLQYSGRSPAYLGSKRYVTSRLS